MDGRQPILARVEQLVKTKEQMFTARFQSFQMGKLAFCDRFDYPPLSLSSFSACLISMRHVLSFCVLWFAFVDAGKAAPAFPVESLCNRAETVPIARVVSYKEGVITFQRVEQLRGRTDDEFVLQRREGVYTFKPGAEYLLFSQGDDRYGPPHPIVANPISGQIVWCGWLPYAIARVDGQVYVDRIFAAIPGEPFPDNLPKNKAVESFIWGLSLAHIKGVVERFPYKPQINDHSRYVQWQRD